MVQVPLVSQTHGDQISLGWWAYCGAGRLHSGFDTAHRGSRSHQLTAIWRESLARFSQSHMHWLSIICWTLSDTPFIYEGACFICGFCIIHWDSSQMACDVDLTREFVRKTKKAHLQEYDLLPQYILTSPLSALWNLKASITKWSFSSCALGRKKALDPGSLESTKHLNKILG